MKGSVILRFLKMHDLWTTTEIICVSFVNMYFVKFLEMNVYGPRFLG